MYFRCKNNQNETKLLISEVLDAQWRGGSLQGKVLGGMNWNSSYLVSEGR